MGSVPVPPIITPAFALLQAQTPAAPFVALPGFFFSGLNRRAGDGGS